jgi:uncharacterized protein YlxP (DUF503 family)
MVIGLLSISVSIPEARSLKDKRTVLRSMKDRIMHRMNVSVAEVGRQDAWKFADMAFVTIAAKKDVVEQRLAELLKVLQSNPRWVLTGIHTELL